MQRVIGLDIGSYSIKAVEIVNTFKSYEIANFYENVIPHGEELDPDVVLPACMEQLFKENNLKADRIIIRKCINIGADAVNCFCI